MNEHTCICVLKCKANVRLWYVKKFRYYNAKPLHFIMCVKYYLHFLYFHHRHNACVTTYKYKACNKC